MTEENYLYRTSPLMLRNQFPGTGAWHIPIIPKAAFSDEDFTDLRLIGFDRTKSNDYGHTDWMVHFFLYDYKFERVWKQPEQAIERLRPYRAVLSPDFSMYLEMNPVIQLYNVFRNRWCGAYLAGKGLRVIPTVSWGDESTFDFCFEGIPKGSTVAVSTYMVSEHGHHADQKGFFMKGYRKLLRYGATAVAIMTAVIFAGVMLFAPQIASIFVDAEKPWLAADTAGALRRYGLCYLLLGGNILMGGFLTAVEQPKAAISISVGRGLAFQAGALFLLAFAVGGTAIWYAPLVSEALCAVMAVLFMRKFLNKTKAA